jgi:hypothetical protein
MPNTEKPLAKERFKKNFLTDLVNMESLTTVEVSHNHFSTDFNIF